MAEVPNEIRKLLDSARRRVRLLQVARGLLRVFADALLALTAVLAIEAMVGSTDVLVRYAMLGVVVAAASASAWFALVIPLSRKVSDARLAALLERRHPELCERLSSAVELSEDGVAERSRPLYEHMVTEARADAAGISVGRELPVRGLRRRLVVALAALLAFAGSYALFPKAAKTLVEQVVLPQANVGNVYSAALEVEPGDVTIPFASPLEIKLSADPELSRRAYVEIRTPNGRVRRERMKRLEPGRFSLKLRRLTQGFSYRVVCGRGESRAFEVTVLPPPPPPPRPETLPEEQWNREERHDDWQPEDDFREEQETPEEPEKEEPEKEEPEQEEPKQEEPGQEESNKETESEQPEPPPPTEVEDATEKSEEKAIAQAETDDEEEKDSSGRKGVQPLKFDSAWLKSKRGLRDVDATEMEKVPAEYRPLVRAYFEAMNKGEGR